MRWIKPLLTVITLCIIGTTAWADKAGIPAKEPTAIENASVAYNSGEYADARSHSREACLHGEAKGCGLLADLNRRGWGGSQDITQAVNFYHQACDGGEGTSCATLAHLYHQGTGIDQDFTEARTLYDAGCIAGEISACAAYGNMVYAGLGGVKDTNEGQAVLRLACRDEYEWACNRLWQYGLKQ